MSEGRPRPTNLRRRKANKPTKRLTGATKKAGSPELKAVRDNLRKVRDEKAELLFQRRIEAVTGSSEFRVFLKACPFDANAAKELYKIWPPGEERRRAVRTAFFLRIAWPHGRPIGDQLDSLVFGLGVIQFDRAEAMSLSEIEEAFARAAAWHRKAKRQRE